MAPAKLVAMGRCAGSFGLGGEVKLSSFAEDPELFAEVGQVYLGPTPQAAKPYELLEMRPHGGRLLLKLAGVETREDAAALGGAWVYLPSDELPPPGPDEFYWHEVIGARVFDAAGAELGVLHAISETNAHDMLVVRGPGKLEALIPLVEGVLKEVDPAGGRVVVDPPEGLLEAQGWQA